MSGPAEKARFEYRTQRLVVRRLVSGSSEGRVPPAGLDAISAILTPAVLEHLPEPLQMPAGSEPVESWVVARLAESDVYSVSDLKAAAIIGLMILGTSAEPGGISTLRLGYLLAEPAWGRGYGTELVAGLLQQLQDIGWKGQVLAGVSAGNPASSRILLKAGFTEIPGGEVHSRIYQYLLA